MTRIKSRLKETDFSRINLRDAYITDYPEYAAALRDEALFSNYGIKALIKVPKYENNVDEYSNFVDDDFEITTESVVPKFDQYRQNVSVEGMAGDGTEGLYPLGVLIPTKLHLPKNSRIILTEYNSKEYIVAREWTVLSTEMKQLSGSKTYTRVAYCVPARHTIHRTLEFDPNYSILYFEIHKVKDITINKNLRALGCLYFDIPQVKLDKMYFLEIEETPMPMSAENQEVLNNETDIAYQEALMPVPGEERIKAISAKVTSSFVVKPTTISVLY